MEGCVNSPMAGPGGVRATVQLAEKKLLANTD